MKTPANIGWSRLELLMVIAVGSLLSSVLLWGQNPKQVERRISCVSQLKQIGLAFRMWSNDNNDRFPMQVKRKDGGSLEAIAESASFRHFQTISNELVQARLLACPLDPDRTPATNFTRLQNLNLSYFVALDADETQPTRFLSGDRNITNALPVQGSVLDLSPKVEAGWTEKIHGGQGQIGFSDGSVQQLDSRELRRRIAQTGDARNRIQLPEAGSGSEE